MGIREVIAGLSVALIATTANAGVMYSLEDGYIHSTQQAGATTLNLNYGACGGYATCSGAGYQFVTGSVSGQYAQPHGTNTRYLTVGNGSVSLSLNDNYDYFGLYWGSADTYNHLSFFLDGLLIDTFSGNELAPLMASGNQTSYSSNRYVNFLFDGGSLFDQVVLSSTGYAFESENHAFGRVKPVSVPEPGTLALLGAGLIPLVWRRKRAAAQA